MQYENDKIVSVHYDSILEFENFDKSNLPEVNKRGYEFNINKKNKDINWLGPTLYSTKQALEKAEQGDMELYNKHLIPKIEELNRHLAKNEIADNINVVPVVRRKRKRSDFGNEVDIHYVNQGALDRAWTTTERIEFDQEHHLITILIDIGGLSNVKALDTLWTSAACLKICDDLQKAGKNVQIIIGGVVTDLFRDSAVRKIATNTCTVKKYNEYLNVERLSAMTHIGFHRTFGFLTRTTFSYKIDIMGMGYSTNFFHNTPVHIQEEIKEGKTKLIILDKCLSLYSAVNCIKNVHKQIIANK